LFEMLTGALPFPGRDRQQVMQDIVRKPTPDPRELNPAVPSSLATIVATAMQKKLRKRFATAKAFAGELHDFLAQNQAAADESTALWEQGGASGTDRAVLEALLKVTQRKPPFRGRIWIRRHGQRHARDILTVTRDNRDCCRIGETFVLQAQADADCYLTLLDAGTTGNLYVLLLNHRLRGGEIATLDGPDKGHEWIVGGQPGVERIKAFFTRQPLTIAAAEPFSPLASTNRSRDILTRIKEVGMRLEQMPADSWTDATCQFIVESGQNLETDQ
jgi:hypothetical protein